MYTLPPFRSVLNIGLAIFIPRRVWPGINGERERVRRERRKRGERGERKEKERGTSLFAIARVGVSLYQDYC